MESNAAPLALLAIHLLEIAGKDDAEGCVLELSYLRKLPLLLRDEVEV